MKSPHKEAYLYRLSENEKKIQYLKNNLVTNEKTIAMVLYEYANYLDEELPEDALCILLKDAQFTFYYVTDILKGNVKDKRIDDLLRNSEYLDEYLETLRHYGIEE